jgi:acetoacetate decarboxylase
MTDHPKWQAPHSRRPSVEDICRPGFSTPWDAPTVPTFPFSFRNVEVLTLSYRTTTAAVERVLPPPLEPTTDVVLIHIYRMNDVDWLGTYGESNVMVGARYAPAAQAGSYSPYLFLSSDVGVVHGREIHGQPKKLGEVSLRADGDAWVGLIRRNGIDVVTGTLGYKQYKGSLDELGREIDFALNINLKAIDHIDGRPAIRQLTARKLADLTVHECWSGPCSVELRPNVQAPVFRLPVVEPLVGYYWRADFTLVEGRVLHDYLATDVSSNHRRSAE